MPAIQTAPYQCITYATQAEYEAGIQQLYVLGWLLVAAWPVQAGIYATFRQSVTVAL